MSRGESKRAEVLGMRQICLPALTAALLLTGIGCEPDHCTCDYKRDHPYSIGRTYTGHDMWSPVGDRENDARIVKLLAAHGVTVGPSNPVRNTGLRPIVVDRLDQMECAEKLLFEAAVRGEITVVFGPGPFYWPPTTQRAEEP